MSLVLALYDVIVRPLELLFELTFNISYNLFCSPIISIVILSVFMNLLALPMYARAERIQKVQRDKEKAIRNEVKHIKKTFKGDEQYMLLQTFYRQNNYKPIDVLKGSVSLLLEIPFFVAAYRFLSSLSLFNGVGLWLISDLSSPDSLIVIGNISINVLPIIMTLINIVSSSIYTKGYSFTSKLQLYGVAIIFLVLLYNSPASLVIYWTLNNLFSLMKNVIEKIEPTSKVYTKINFDNYDNVSLDKYVFVLACVVLVILVGLLIPSMLIESSPTSFVDTQEFISPIKYIFNAFLIAVGSFLFWPLVIYQISSENAKSVFCVLLLIFDVISIVNYLFFGTNLGILSNELVYEDGLFFSNKEIFINILVLGLITLIFYYFVIKRFNRIIKSLLVVTLFTMLIMSSINIVNINSVINSSMEALKKKYDVSLDLDANAKNVVVIMLDRAISAYLPYVFNESEEIANAYEGFTYYPNTVSFGCYTNMAIPAVFGGYEYTPYEINKRDSESLESKHNEALKVLPVSFYNFGYKVTVCDPSYAGYSEVPDLSIYDDYDGIKKYITKGKYNDNSENNEVEIDKLDRDVFCYSLCKVLPLGYQEALYDDGNYNRVEIGYGIYNVIDIYKSTGYNDVFMDSYNVLTNLTNISTITNSGVGSFVILCNETTHEPTLLSLPSYEPAKIVDNTEFENNHILESSIDSNVISLNNVDQVTHYQTNYAVLKQIGKWLDYLRENNVYDNTRIIIVSDHGRDIGQFEERILDEDIDTMFFNALLLVKDFDEKDFKIDNTLMTNADVPYLSTNGIINDLVNPFTGNMISNGSSVKSNLKLWYSNEWQLSLNNGNTFSSNGKWLTVEDSIFDIDNWDYIS